MMFQKSRPVLRILVLIETLWNVNKQALNNIETVFPVLIETLWNVNWVATSGNARELRY